MGRLAAMRVRALRIEREWPARRLAEECDRAGMSSLNRSTIAKIESGARRITADEIAVLARVFEVTATELLETPGRVLLHLPDLHVGGDQVADDRGPSIGEDLRRLEDDLGLKPEVVVISGDITMTGTEPEFDQALVVLERLGDALEIDRRRMIIVPGDQDISRTASRAYFRGCEANDQQPRPPYAPKWKPFIAMLARFYGGEKAVVFDEEQPWTLFQLPELWLVIAGLNSTMADSHRDEDHYGEVGKAQLRWFAERLRAFEEPGWLRIGVVHHDVLRGAADDPESLRDADDLGRILAPPLDLLLCGHGRDVMLHRLSNSLPTLSGVSVAARAFARPAVVPSRYQLVSVQANRVERWTRIYKPDKRQWLPDTRISPQGHSWDLVHEGSREGRSGSPRHPEVEVVTPISVASSESARLLGGRRDELATLTRGLAKLRGPHFWLVIAPPGLGKSWFLHRLREKLALDDPPRWVTRLIDVREEPPDVRSDVASLLTRLFGLPSSATIEPRTLRDIAREISKGGKPTLCLLDSAELLEEEIARTLRSYLSEIYHLVQEAGNADVRLAFVVASRREDEWRGLSPPPRLAVLPLIELEVDTVQQALQDLAQQMHRNFAPAVLQQNAERVHRLSEGLPDLLGACLQWIQSEEWLDLERLDDQEVFEELARSYIQTSLLSVKSLFPGGGRQLREQRDALEEAFRLLAPYRLFTQSHLRHHFESDTADAVLDRLRWTIEDLWGAISGTALLERPLHEPWQEVYPAIRRLLYRYYYKSDEQRADAHRAARKFIEVWADKQVGKEQVIGLVECLWHEAAVLRLDQPGELEKELIRSAKRLSLALRPSPAYTVRELQAYAAERMRNDEELQAALRDASGPELLDRLLRTITAPPQESRHE
jgi:transcriptional regulator with XRE-family HTH domain